jgi:hypothetical protein
MLENHERFKNITEGIQSVIIAVAVLIGGIWTAYTFSALHTTEKAKADLATVQLTNEKAKEERERAAAELAMNIEKAKEEREQAKEEREQASARLAIEKAKDEREQASTQLAMALERAKNEREQAEYKIKQDKELAEQKRLANYGLDITIDAKQEQPTNNDGYYISVLVKVRNKGVTNRFIDFNKPPLFVREIGFNENGEAITKSFLEEKLISYIVLRTDTTVDYPFVIKLPRQGFYLITFEVKLNEEEMKIHRQSGGPNEEVYWAGTTYLLVK